MKIYSLFIKKFTAKCPITLGLKFRRKFFEEAKKRGSLVSGFRAQSPPRPGSTMISQDPRASRLHVREEGSERKGGEKRFHARDLDEDQAWSDRWRCVCGIPWSSVNFTRLETVKPDPDHVEDAHPGIRGTWIPDRDISIYLSSKEPLWKTKPSRTFFSIQLWIPTRSTLDPVCFSFLLFLFSFFFLPVVMTVPPFLLLIYSIIERCFFSNFLWDFSYYL